MPLRPPAGFVSANFDPLKNPDAPTGVAASGGDAQASVSFSAPGNPGGSAISAYYAVSNPDRITVSGATSPITVTGLTNGTSYTFQVWALNSYGPGAFSAASGSVTPVAPRGLFAGGFNTSTQPTNVIDYISIATAGNAIDFGDLPSVTNSSVAGSVSSTTRGIFPYGQGQNSICYIEISTTSNATDFGDLTRNLDQTSIAGASSSTRGLFAGGIVLSARSNIIDYITIASIGNAIDFGDLTTAMFGNAGVSSSTRAVFGGGDGPTAASNVMSYVTISTLGNAIYFGDLYQSCGSLSAASSSTRGLFFGGKDYIPYINVIQYITISSTGNSIDFGDLSNTFAHTGAASSETRATIAGGRPSSAISGGVSSIIFVTISTLGNTTNFGNLTVARSNLSACSNAHGGLA